MKAIWLGSMFLLAMLCAAQQSNNIDAPKVRMKIHRLTLKGAEAVDVRPIVRDIEALDLGYEPSCSDGYIREVIRDRFQQQGYFKAYVDEPHCTMLRRGTHEVWIDVQVRVHPNSVFRLKGISFSGSSVFAPSELRKQVPMLDEDVFRVDEMRIGLKNLREIYCRNGFVNFTPVPNMEMDDTAKSIGVAFDLDEGKRFSYGDLIVDGQESVTGARQRLLAAWRAYKGKPYDCGVSLGSLLRDIHALPNIKPDEVFKLSFDNQTHTVSVAMTLAKPLKTEVAVEQR